MDEGWGQRWLPLQTLTAAIDDFHLWLSAFLVNILEVYPVFFVLIPIEVEMHEAEHFALEVHTDEHTFNIMVGVLRVPYHHLGVAIMVGGELVLSHGSVGKSGLYLCGQSFGHSPFIAFS